MDTEEHPKDKEKVSIQVPAFLKDKKFQVGAVILLFLITLFIGVQIRYQPIANGNLIDATTGDYTPLALDPYYFLRVSETLLADNGTLPAQDMFRAGGIGVPWHNEILPESTVALYKIIKTFNPSVTLNYADVLNPVVFFVIGLIAFFTLVWFLTKNKWIALISSAILTVIPPYLYRTLAGFSDHEAIGMFGFFTALLTFAISMNYLDKNKAKKTNLILLGLLTGFSMVLSIATWGGIAKFTFLIVPLAFLVNWFVNKNKEENYVLYYISLIIGAIVSMPIFGYPVGETIKTFMFNVTGILTIFTLGFIIISYILPKIKQLDKNYLKYKNAISIALTIVLGAVVYQLFIGNIFSMILNLITTIFDPFGTGRLTVTVAENANSYTSDLIAQIGNTVFYLFLLGCLMLGINISKGIKNKKYRPLFSISFIAFILGLLYSAVSASSILNGDSFLSHIFVFGSFLIFAFSSIYIYNKSEWSINSNLIIMASWTIPIVLAVLGAVRFLFAVVPLVSFMAIYGIFELFKLGRKNKDELIKLGSIFLVILVSIFLIISLTGFYKTVKAQAAYQTPSYNTDWQNAMSWVRNNTAEDSLFVHWWDYGYWVQTGGNRATVADGGQVQATYFGGNEKIGRYVLTTPIPATAKSFMKTFGVDYLLIDPTDIGKYSAYSSIGDGDEVSDRASYLVTFASDPTETQESRNMTTRLYRGGIYLDEDLRYKNGTTDLFLPKGKAAIGGIVLSTTTDGKVMQPEGIYIYSGKQYRLPIRNLYVDGKLMDFKSGINATAYIYPNVYSASGSQKIDQMGAAMYLSAKTQDSLVAQLYLMNDPNNLYPELELVHEESKYHFSFYYGGYQGAIKIYKVHTEEMDNILTHEEFKQRQEGADDLDNLDFVRR